MGNNNTVIFDTVIPNSIQKWVNVWFGLMSQQNAPFSDSAESTPSMHIFPRYHFSMTLYTQNNTEDSVDCTHHSCSINEISVTQSLMSPAAMTNE